MDYASLGHMKTFSALLVAVAFIVAGCGQSEPAKAPAPDSPPPKQPEKKAETSSGNPITAPVDYLAAAAKAKHSADATIDTAALNQQVQLFFAQEGRYPKDLDELVTQKYMKVLPTPPAGMKLEYNAANGTVKVVKQ
jgi:hypothetical protein